MKRYRRSDGKLVGSRHPNTHCTDCKHWIKVGYKGRCSAYSEPGESESIGHLVNEECPAFESLSGRQSCLGDWARGAV